MNDVALDSRTLLLQREAALDFPWLWTRFSDCTPAERQEHLALLNAWRALRAALRKCESQLQRFEQTTFGIRQET